MAVLPRNGFLAGVGHLTLIGAFAPDLRVLAPVLRDVTQFVWRVTSGRANLVRARNASPPRRLTNLEVS